MALETLKLEVRVSGVRVGQLFRALSGKVVFRPDEDWIRREQLPPLGLAFLRDQSLRQAASGIPAWFEHLLPARGGALRTWIEQQEGGQKITSFQLLHRLGHDLPGAVELREMGSLSPAPPEDTEHWDDTLPRRLTFSLAGMQLKFSMKEVNHRYVLPSRDAEGRWLVKLPSHQFPLLPEIEAFTMDWSRATGFRTPECRVIETQHLTGVGSRLVEQSPFALAVARFDRTDDGQRIHQEDFAQALDIGTEDSEIYGRRGEKRVSYDMLVRLVMDAAGESSRDEFIERVAFMLASGNTDAHLKNWSFQWQDTFRPQLSPCYDQVCTIAFERFGWHGAQPPSLALVLGKAAHCGAIELKTLKRFEDSSQCVGAEERFVEGLKKARRAFHSLAKSCPAMMRQALEEHWQQVPLLKQLGGLLSA